jgi:hypothetical protein
VRDVNFFVSEIIADGAILQVLSKKEGREPLRFDLQFLRLHDVSLDQPMKYVTRLTNPRPPGLVRSTGKFGPWDAEDPSMTPLEGEFLFTDADLSDFKGISGILKSEGKFKGVLEEFTVDGAAEVPDFRLNISGNPVHLKTSYHAIVDGTNGDTRLEPVRAEFLSSKVVARGAVEGEKGKKGKGVRLDVDVSRARIEDLLKLSTRGNNPLLTGPIRFQTKFYLPPGKEDVVQKLTLDGRFRIDKGEFRKNSLQEKIDSLSRKGQGKPGDTAVHHVPSDLQAQFQLAQGMIRFQDLLFRVAGAGVNLDGYYGLENEELDFQGRLQLDAKISQTTTGFKSLILRPIDPLFSRKGHGSVLPITIKGTRSKPEFGIDLGKTIRRSR